MTPQQQILDALPGSQAIISQRTGLRLATVSSWLSIMQAQHTVRIRGWIVQPRGGKPIAVYEAGGGPGEPRPAMSIGAVRSKTWRVRRVLQ